jgi:hypothetical protein
MQSMLMMTIQMQMMMIYSCALFVLKQLILTEIEDMLTQMDNANANVTIITIV